MTYREARVYLDEISKYGSVLGLESIRALLEELGNPQQDLRFIHIAGTNGKGSVLAYTSNILKEEGYRTGSYVSPAVLSYLERIQVDGMWITEDDFAESVDEVQKAIARMEENGEASPTVFEAETAVAFLHFKKQGCDIVVLETGLGGSLDATNIVEHTVAAVFTSISRDHMEFLGESLTDITENKAGIMKPGCLAVTARQVPEVMEVLIRRAGELQCRLFMADDREAHVMQESYRGQKFSYGCREELWTPLAGKHQISNAVTVLSLVEALKQKGFGISDEAVRMGFAKTSWPGRFTCISEKPLFIADGAHNEEAVLRLRESLLSYFPHKKFIFIVGMFRDKEYEKIAGLMGPIASRIYTVTLPDQRRSLKADEWKRWLDSYCAQVEAAPDLEAAVDKAFAAERAFGQAEEDGRGGSVIVAFGSLSYLGRIMELVQARNRRKSDG